MQIALAVSYGEFSFLYQNFLMPPFGRFFGIETNPIKFCETRKTTYINFSQCLLLQGSVEMSDFTSAQRMWGILKSKVAMILSDI